MLKGHGIIKLRILDNHSLLANGKLTINQGFSMLFWVENKKKKFKYIYQMLTDGTLQDVKALASGRNNQ